MRRLSTSDAAALLEVVAELHDLHDPLPFPPRLLARLRQLIPCDYVGYYDMDTFAQRSLLNVWHEDGDEGVVVGDEGWWETPGERELFWRIRDTNPVCAYRFATADWTTPYMVSDFATLREFRSTPFYDAFIRGSANYLLQMSLAATPARERGFGLWRRAPDFDERDRLVLDLLQPHLAARAKAVATAVEAAEAIAELEDGQDEPHLVVLCSGLDERKRRLERLTAREREILARVADGKQNDLIARELGIAPGTVAKHLEHTYRKLAVPNRTAAAAALRE